MDAEAQSNFVRSRLPWLVAAGALVVYLLTLNRWLSLNSLYVAGLLQEPPYGTPLLYLLTLPFRLLPGAGPLLGLNVTSALFAALTLALLARSIALLPHDRTREQRRREPGAHGLLSLGTAWLPPLVAALVLGTQLTFWEHATVATGEMLDLLLFAYIIRCLLEYRIDQRESWLMRMGFVYGLAITNNWAMIGFFPLAVAALIWIRGTTFFRASFLVRLTLWGLAGLLLYLLMPLVQVLQEGSAVTFWEALRLQFAIQRRTLLSMPRLVTLFAALASVVPLILISIRWPSNVGDTSAVGNILYLYVFRLLFGGFLAFGLWMMLDPAWSPRALIARRIELAAESVVAPTYLAFYYLAALVVGYFIGYCLLVFGQPEPHRHRRRETVTPWLGKATAALAVLASLGVAGLLAWRNAPVVRNNNGLILKEFAERCLQQMPDEVGVGLSDRPQLYSIVRLLQAHTREATPHVLVNTLYLPFTAYQRELYRQTPDIWPDFVMDPALDRTRRIPHEALMLEIGAIANQTPTYYLHWSFGFYFEPLYLEPRNLLFHVRAYQTNMPKPPPPAPEVLDANSAYWNELWPLLEPVVAGVQRGSTDARMVGRWYSQSLNAWGVALQRAAPDQWAAAATFFERARLLNPDNASATINLDYNRSRQAGRPRSRVSGSSATEYFGPKYRTWSDVMRINGPIDDPHFCVELGSQFLNESLFRQASVQFLRALELAPENNRVRVQLAQAYTAIDLYDVALEVIETARQEASQHPLNLDEHIELRRLKALALRGRGQAEEGERELRAALATHARDPGAGVLINALVELYVATERDEEAIALIEAQLPHIHASALEPLLLIKARLFMLLERYEDAGIVLRQILARNANHPQALLTQGALYIQLGRFSNAIPPLDQLLELAPQNAAGRLNRAIAHLQNGNLDQARKDYQQLLDELPRPPHAIYFGLGEIAWQKKDFREATEHYEAYLRAAPPETEEAREVARRLEAIHSGNL
jgi:tetratricopeptide (TPR) repeat protein